MRVPADLGARGKALWKSIIHGLPEGWEFTERELAVLAMACRQADTVQRLEQAIKRDGEMSTGSQGQPVVNPAVVEARQGRLAVNRLLGNLELPDADEEPRTVAGLRGQRAARSRWDRRDRLDDLRRAKRAP